MKILQTWKRNMPDTSSGYSITVSYTYSSTNKGEIDEIEKKLPKSYILMDTDKSQRIYPLKKAGDIE